MELHEKTQMFIKIIDNFIMKLYGLKLDILDELKLINGLKVLDNNKFDLFDEKTKKELLNRNSGIYEEFFEYIDRAKTTALYLIYSSTSGNLNEVFDIIDSVDYLKVVCDLRDIYNIQKKLQGYLIEESECHYKDMIMQDKTLYIKTNKILNVLINSLKEVRSNLINVKPDEYQK